MKLLIFSRLYPPSVGGMETVMSLLAEEFEKAGNDVTVVTETGSKDASKGKVKVLRRIGILRAVREVLESNFVIHSNISLRNIWFSLLFRKPTLVIHHTWYRRPGGKVSIVDRLKLFLTKLVTNVSVSKAISVHLPSNSYVVENPYDAASFKVEGEKSKISGDIISVGRLVSDKGFHVLIEAYSMLPGEKPSLTIVGDGPEMKALMNQAAVIGGKINFLGTKSPSEIASLLRSHKVFVIPSVWEEPFGVVALEALACGCRVVASDVGGLKDAVGGFGILIPPNDPRKLSDAIMKSLDLGRLEASSALDGHLNAHSPKVVSEMYFSILKELLS